MIRRRWVIVLFVVALAAVLIVACASPDRREDQDPPVRSPSTTVEPDPGSTLGAAPRISQRTYILALLAAVNVVPERPNVPGFDPALFPATDDAAGVPLAGNGCPTRDDILGGALLEVVTRDGCAVTSGWLQDPYTGDLTQYGPGTVDRIEIDHIVPLRYAWDMGAHDWQPVRRTRFANDPGTMLAAAGAVIAQKHDLGPGGWMPPNSDYRCDYAAHWLRIVDDWELAITEGDRDAILRLLASCPGPETPSRPPNENP